MVFADRVDAGRQLAAKLRHLRGEPVVVLGLPRGGVPVALEVARELGAPLDVIVVRKLGVPFQPELGMGAVGEDGVRVINREIVGVAEVSEDDLAEVEARQRAEVTARAARYRVGRPRQPLDGRVAVVVDDGVATGSTALAACQIARAQGAARVVLAVPVAPPGWEERIGSNADELICLDTPAGFLGVGQFYAHFPQTADEEVIACLEAAAKLGPTAGAERAGAERAGAEGAGAEGAGAGADRAAAASGGGSPASGRRVAADAGVIRLAGDLTVPDQATGIVVFAHGSGSSRHSPRNRYVAGVLNDAGLGTLLLDLLTPEEELDRGNVFDIEMLARRLTEVTGWLGTRPVTADLAVGYFGASTGAAAALWAAADAGTEIAAVVSRGGRPDLAGPRLAEVTAPTLLIVGGNDELVLDLNYRAQAELRCENDLAIVPGATHLFEEPGTLDTVARLARGWFASHLARGAHHVS